MICSWCGKPLQHPLKHLLDVDGTLNYFHVDGCWEEFCGLMRLEEMGLPDAQA